MLANEKDMTTGHLLGVYVDNLFSDCFLTLTLQGNAVCELYFWLKLTLEDVKNFTLSPNQNPIKPTVFPRTVRRFSAA